jgi:hypothetical protein
MKVDKSVLFRTVEKAWVERTSDVELVYPYRLNPQEGLLRIWACKLGDYLTSGRTPYAMVLDGSDVRIREAATILSKAHVSASIVLGDEQIIVDSTLCSELYAGLIEFIVEVELGDLLLLYPGSHGH